MADKPISYADLPPPPNPPAIPKRNDGEDADTYAKRIAVAYRHGNIWAASSVELGSLLLRQLGANEPLRPETREEVIDILGRLRNLTKPVSQMTPDYKPEYRLPETLRRAIDAKLQSEASAVKTAYAYAAG